MLLRKSMDRRAAIRWIAGGVGLLAVRPGELLAAEDYLRDLERNIRNAYSRHNRSRPRRDATRNIVLHVTDGDYASSRHVVRRDGTCNYFVRRSDGRAERIIDKWRLAKHAGDSLWDGRYDLSRDTLSIEFQGWADEDLSDAQYATARWMLDELCDVAGLSDDAVVTHSMVAFGGGRRGRKLDGVLLHNPEARSRMGLGPGVRVDPDVAAGRVSPHPQVSAALYESDHVQESFAKAPILVVDRHTLVPIDFGPEFIHERMVYRLPDGSRRFGYEMEERETLLLPSGTWARRYW